MERDAIFYGGYVTGYDCKADPSSESAVTNYSSCFSADVDSPPQDERHRADAEEALQQPVRAVRLLRLPLPVRAGAGKVQVDMKLLALKAPVRRDSHCTSESDTLSSEVEVEGEDGATRYEMVIFLFCFKRILLI